MSTLRGRVVNVRSRGDGTYGVTCVASAAAREFLWLTARTPPRLGALLEIEGATTRRFQRNRGQRAAITVVEDGATQIIADKWARRFVPQPWLDAVLRSTRLRLYPHQVEGAAWLAERLSQGRGALLCDDPGLGKTVQAASALLVARALPAVIVCPSSLKINWQRELRHLVADLSTHVLEGFEGPIDPAHVVITNYELLREREQQLRRLGARCIVFDEGQVLKEPEPETNHRAAVATRLAKAIGRVVVLTGTPMPNDARELWRLLHLVDPEAWASFADFKRRYCLEPERDDLLVGRQIVTEHSRVHNVGELQTRMQPFMLRRLKANVLDQLPPKRRRTVLVELEPSDRKHYMRAQKDFVTWLREVRGGPRMDPAASGQALLKLQMLRRIAAIGKLRSAVPRYLKAWYERPNARPLVIFGYHKAVLRGVTFICQSLGLRIATIRGQDAGDKRMRAVDDFNNGDADVFIAPLKAAGTGLNLQSARDMLCVERLFVPYVMSQAEDRLHRIGQRHEVVVTYLDARDTVDQRIATVLAAKQYVIDQVIDDRDAPDREVLRAETIEAVVASFQTETP